MSCQPPLNSKEEEERKLRQYGQIRQLGNSFDTMGRHFGDLAKIRHIITYSISPFEQRAFPHYFSKGIPNVWRRFSSSIFKVAPPMILMYLTYTWGNHVHEQSKRKNAMD
ncbi:cytochrome b-c1 complex subunit 8 [Tachysurus fulvidraco]|uniref:cytochrome b-c1 complex subunit 8 n=1 Tax=Tachysurus fulvidraco TaxID=1234273 RepID=UPI000F4D7C2F|nr:cytochrome b-c1 complex subunit 8 [Tachysurus fulvidraco]